MLYTKTACVTEEKSQLRNTLTEFSVKQWLNLSLNWNWPTRRVAVSDDNVMISEYSLKITLTSAYSHIVSAYGTASARTVHAVKFPLSELACMATFIRCCEVINLSNIIHCFGHVSPDTTQIVFQNIVVFNESMELAIRWSFAQVHQKHSHREA